MGVNRLTPDQTVRYLWDHGVGYSYLASENVNGELKFLVKEKTFLDSLAWTIKDFLKILHIETAPNRFNPKTFEDASLLLLVHMQTHRTTENEWKYKRIADQIASFSRRKFSRSLPALHYSIDSQCTQLKLDFEKAENKKWEAITYKNDKWWKDYEARRKASDKKFERDMKKIDDDFNASMAGFNSRPKTSSTFGSTFSYKPSYTSSTSSSGTSSSWSSYFSFGKPSTTQSSSAPKAEKYVEPYSTVLPQYAEKVVAGGKYDSYKIVNRKELINPVTKQKQLCDVIVFLKKNDQLLFEGDDKSLYPDEKDKEIMQRIEIQKAVRKKVDEYLDDNCSKWKYDTFYMCDSDRVKNLFGFQRDADKADALVLFYKKES